jgi:carboxymethylenebutenolidase
MRPLLKTLALSCCIFPLAITCTAQDWAKAALAKSPRHGEYVTIKEPSGRNLQAFVVYPEIKEKAPVVVLIHEIFGSSDWFKEMADEIAGAGYIVVAPDLLSGLGPAPAAAALQPGSVPDEPITMTPCPSWAGGTGQSGTSCTVTSSQMRQMMASISLSGTGCDPMDCAPGQKPLLHRTALDAEQQADPNSHMQMPSNGAPFVPATPGGTPAFPDELSVRRAVGSLPDAQVMADLDAAADYGKKLPAANGKLYDAGFCWGGGEAFLFATHRHDLTASFVFYGVPPSAESMKSITAPVYGFYAGNDARVTATVPQTVIDMKAANKKYEPVTYDGAGHGFMRAGEAPNANAANAAARAAAFRRLVNLLGGIR